MFQKMILFPLCAYLVGCASTAEVPVKKVEPVKAVSPCAPRWERNAELGGRVIPQVPGQDPRRNGSDGPGGHLFQVRGVLL